MLALPLLISAFCSIFHESSGMYYCRTLFLIKIQVCTSHWQREWGTIQNKYGKYGQINGWLPANTVPKCVDLNKVFNYAGFYFGWLKVCFCPYSFNGWAHIKSFLFNVEHSSYLYIVTLIYLLNAKLFKQLRVLTSMRHWLSAVYIF